MNIAEPGAFYPHRQQGSATLGAGVGSQRLDGPAPSPTELSELAGQINILRDQLCFAQQLANEISALADNVGGPVPTDAGVSAEKGGIRVFKLSEINEVIQGLSGALGSIHSDLNRLRRYVG